MSGNAIGWTIAAAILVLVIVAVCCSHIVIRSSITRKGADDNIDVTVKALFGLFRYNLRIPVAFFQNQELKLKMKASGTPVQGVTESEAEIDQNVIERFFEKLMDVLRFTRDLSGLARHLIRKLKLTELSWSTAVGTGDAVSTAMATGLVWSVKTAAAGILSQLVRLQAHPQMAVAPQFNRAMFETRIDALVKIRVGHIMMAGIRLFGRILKVKGGMSGWLELLTNPRPRNA